MSFLANSFRPILAAVGGLCALFFFPWAALIVMAILAFRYRAWEVLLLGALLDFLWLPAGSLFAPAPVFTVLSIVLVWGLEPLRARYLVA